MDANGWTVSHEIAEFMAAMLNRLLPPPPAQEVKS